MNPCPDLIFVSMENWDDVWRRNQFVVAGLARLHPEMKVVFVGLPRDVSNDLRHRRLSSLRRPATWRVPGLPNVTVTHPLKLLPDSLPVCRGVNEKLVRDHVRRVAASAGVRRPILWLNPHHAVHMVGRMDERAVIYDVTDDWTALSQSDALRRRTRAQDARLCAVADRVIVCSDDLYAGKRALARHVHLIRNGVNADHYASVLDPGAPAGEAANWPRPVLGYTGTIHPDRIDVTLIEDISRRWEQGSIVLIGPDHLPPADAARLRRRANVHRLGPVPYADIARYMRGFDVCITPHRVTPFTESLNPIKLWEYLASGKPIVSTPVAGFRDYPRHVRLASSADAFVAAAREALDEGPAPKAARRAEARRHSWDARLDEIEHVLDACAADARVVESADPESRVPDAHLFEPRVANPTEAARVG